jgi:hypothetical protein
MAESTIGGTTGGEVLVKFLDRPKPKPKSNAVGTGMAKGTTNRGMVSGTSTNNGMSDKEYLGYGFDAAVRVGVDRARNAFINRIKNLDEGKKQVLMQRFDNEIANQKSLQKDRGLGEGMEKSYREAGKAGKPLTLDYATRARNAEVVKKLPQTIGNAIKRNIVEPERKNTYYGEGGI